MVLYLSLYLFAVLAPGVAGIYLSAVFGASLSTCSSTINSCSVIVIEDILKPYFKIRKGAITWISKLAMLISGGLIIAFAYIFRNFEGKSAKGLSWHHKNIWKVTVKLIARYG